PSRPNPPTFANGPSYVRASPDLLTHFSDFDTDGSGAISFDELQSSLTNREVSKSRHFNSEVITVLIEMFDNNNDGMIDTLEFPELIAYLRNWNSCFLFLDEDKSGMLEYEEMHHAISAMGLTISHSLMKDIMAKYEFTEKNKIDLDNFILCCVTLNRFKETYEFMIETGGSTCKHIGHEE
ncbi:EF-hand, partial [Backusella circina FSU 941]